MNVTVVNKPAALDPFDSYSILKPAEMDWLIPKPSRRPFVVVALIGLILLGAAYAFSDSDRWSGLSEAVTDYAALLRLEAEWNDAVERAHLVHLAVLPGEPRAGEDEEELLGRAVRMRRRRQLAGLDADAVDAHAARAGGVAEPLPRRVHLALRVASALDLVPVRDRHVGGV